MVDPAQLGGETALAAFLWDGLVVVLLALPAAGILALAWRLAQRRIAEARRELDSVEFPYG